MRIKSNLVGTNIYIKNYELADKLFCTNMWFNKVNGKYLSDRIVPIPSDHVKPIK